MAVAVPQPVLRVGAVELRLATTAYGAASAAIYGPYVEATAISFELTPPTAD